jgi:hypothetical protein
VPSPAFLSILVCQFSTFCLAEDWFVSVNELGWLDPQEVRQSSNMVVDELQEENSIAWTIQPATPKLLVEACLTTHLVIELPISQIRRMTTQAVKVMVSIVV